jgi:uncharacterized membrane protein
VQTDDGDFVQSEAFGVVLGALYAVAGLLIVGLAWWAGYIYLAYPLAAGFALVGPFVAVGLYEVSRRLETGEPLSFGVLFRTIRAKGAGELGWMALVSVMALVLWIYVAGFLYAIFFGLRPIDFAELVTTALTTPRGLVFLLVGTAFGALLATAVFAITAVAVPLLVDRDVDFVTAMITSVKAVGQNLRPMLAWAAIIVALLAIGTIPLFLGLVVVLPVLGHATWHMYRATVS